MYPQLPLPFTLQEDFNFENFIAHENQLVIESLKNTVKLMMISIIPKPVLETGALPIELLAYKLS